MSSVYVPVIGLVVGAALLAMARKSIRPGPVWMAMFPVMGVIGACLALIPAAYTAEEPRLPLVVALLDAAMFAGAWALIARNPAYQPKLYWRAGGTNFLDYEYEEISPDSIPGRKLFKTRRALTGAGVAAGVTMLAITAFGTLRARHEAELGMAGLFLGLGFGGALFGAIPAYLLGGLAGVIAGFVLPPEPELVTYDHNAPPGRLVKDPSRMSEAEFRAMLESDEPLE